MLVTVLVIIIGVLVLGALILWLIGERGRLLRPSTARVLREGGLRSFLNLSDLHGYIYGRWTNQYIRLVIHHILPRMGSRAQRWLSNRYHGKVLTPEHARAIITLDQDIPLRDLEQIIPYSGARKLVLSGPPDVAVYECACRHARANPCQPTQVCMVIGQPFVDFIVDHHPQTARRVTQAEALELLQAEHERGHLHSAWFKDAVLNRFYAICNCCKCCCGAVEAMVKHGIPALSSSGYVARVDETKCDACGRCAQACPFGAIHVDQTSAVNWEACMGCGVCTGACPRQAISLTRDERKGVPLDVRALAEG